MVALITRSFSTIERALTVPDGLLVGIRCSVIQANGMAEVTSGMCCSDSLLSADADADADADAETAVADWGVYDDSCIWLTK